MQTGDDGCVELVLRPLRDRGRLGRRLHAVGSERQLGGNGKDGRAADRLAQLASGVDRGLGLYREHHEVGAADGVRVRGPRRPDGARGLVGPAGIPRADDDLQSGLDQPLGHRLAEAPRAADDGDLHAAALKTASARRLDAARSVMSVLVTTARTASGPVGSDSSTTSASISPS